MDIQRKDKVFASEVIPLPDKERILRFVTSTEIQDRDGDIVEVNGWQIDNYMKNPVVLFGHNYSSLPVGKTVNIEIDMGNKRLIQDIQFPTREEYEFGDTVFKLTRAGYLNTTSVGFMGIEHEPMFDENKTYLGRRYKKQELLETSIVPVPSNPSALIEARSKGIINDNEMKIFNDIGNSTESKCFEGKEDFEMSIEKAGASISSKNKEILKSIHDEIENSNTTLKGCRDKLKAFLIESPEGMEDEMEDEMEDKKKSINKICTCCQNKDNETETEQITKPIKDIEEPTEPEKNTESELATEQEQQGTTSSDDDIDLDSLVDENEIDCTEEELEKALQDLFERKFNQIRGGKTDET